VSASVRFCQPGWVTSVRFATSWKSEAVVECPRYREDMERGERALQLRVPRRWRGPA
jgi:hypothetical protein